MNYEVQCEASLFLLKTDRISQDILVTGATEMDTSCCPIKSCVTQEEDCDGASLNNVFGVSFQQAAMPHKNSRFLLLLIPQEKQSSEATCEWGYWNNLTVANQILMTLMFQSDLSLPTSVREGSADIVNTTILICLSCGPAGAPHSPAHPAPRLLPQRALPACPRLA